MEAIGSLPVASVQALAADLQGSTEIPARYFRPDVDADPVVGGGDSEIPVIDFSKLIDPNFSQDESTRLHLACEEWGFFQLINHNIPSETMERMKIDVIEFFKLPLEEKKALSQIKGNLEGYGQLFVVSEGQKLDWADLLYLNTQPCLQRSMRFWPTQPLTFRATLDRYSSELYSLANCLLGLMAKNLGVKPEVLTNMSKDGIQSVRMNYYPPCHQADKVLGLSPHSDGSLLTLVLQINEVQGLQIKRNGGWIPVKPLPTALIVNIGDCLEIFSNGKYRSIEHRALVSTEKERLSVAAFHNPCADSVVGPLTEIVGGNEANYRTLNHEDFMRLFFSAKLDGKNFLDHMKLGRQTSLHR